MVVKVKMLYWVDEVGGRAESMEIELKPFGYRTAPITQWEVLIAAEDVEVEKGKPVIVRVEPVFLPGNTLVGPLSIMRHALGTLVDVVECGVPGRVEDEKCISRVLFLPVEDGVIKKGDMVGVLKVFYIKTGLLTRILGLEPPKVELKKGFHEAKIVWRDNGNIYREPAKVTILGYMRSHIGVWELLVADETVRVKRGDVLRIRIKEVRLPPNTVVVPLPVMRNAFGTVLDVVQLGKPSRVEEEKTLHQAIFLAVEDGVIEEGDLIGVINVYYVGLGDFKPLVQDKPPEKVRIVYRSGDGIVKREVEVEPFGYRRSPVGKWEALIADESKPVRYGEPVVVKVKRVRVPPKTILYPLHIMRHAYGTVADVFCDCKPWKVEEGGEIKKVVFLPVMDGEIKEGELLGIINLHDVELSPLGRVRQWLDNWLTEMGRTFDEGDWPLW
nr:DUF22 domain-containing protein [Archaeoglobus fulgidus]